MRVISKKLRDSARGQECTLRIPEICNGNPETTVLCHLPCNMAGFGMKSPDNMAVFGCSSCHDVIDGRVRHPGYKIGASYFDGFDLLRALAETQQYWVENGFMTIKGMK